MVYTKIVTSDNLLAVSFLKKEVERELIVTQLEWGSSCLGPCRSGREVMHLYSALPVRVVICSPLQGPDCRLNVSQGCKDCSSFTITHEKLSRNMPMPMLKYGPTCASNTNFRRSFRRYR